MKPYRYRWRATTYPRQRVANLYIASLGRQIEELNPIKFNGLRYWPKICF